MKTKFIFAFTVCLLFAITSTAQCSSSNKHSSHSDSYNSHSTDIVDIALGNDQFSTLVVALKSADLVETLHGTGPFTVFAPVNAAFNKLPEGTVESLLEPQNKQQLTKILTYHVVAGKFNAKDLIGAIQNSGGSFQIETVSGDILMASLRNGTVLLSDESGNTCAVTQTDIQASNGVVHVIDSVVLPN